MVFKFPCEGFALKTGIKIGIVPNDFSARMAKDNALLSVFEFDAFIRFVPVRYGRSTQIPEEGHADFDER